MSRAPTSTGGVFVGMNQARRRWPLIVAVSLCATVLLSHDVFTQAAPNREAPIDVQKLGPQVGAKVPDFSLPDQQGRTRTLRSVMGPKGALLVFFRSADW